jgi:hypothetical protein
VITHDAVAEAKTIEGLAAANTQNAAKTVGVRIGKSRGGDIPDEIAVSEEPG